MAILARHFCLGTALFALAFVKGWAADDLLRGRVVDEVGNPVTDVRILILSPSGRILAETTTATDGSFSVGAVPGGRVAAARFERAGYRTLTVPPPESRQSAWLIRLTTSRIDEHVTVTALRRERPLFETPQAGSIVTADDIRDRAVSSLPAALEGQPGVNIQRTDLGGGSPFIRGLTGNQILLLVDGIRLNNSTFRLGPNQYLNTIDPFAAQRVEIMRGPASSLYGSDGLGGVINVLDTPPAAAPGADIRLGYDTAGRAPLIALRVDEGTERLRFTAGLSGVDYDDLRGGENTGVQSPTGYQRQAADARADVDLGGAGGLSAAVRYFEAEAVPRYDRIESGRDLDFRFDPQRRVLVYVRYARALPGAKAPSLAVTVSRMVQTEGRRIVGSGSAIERRELDEVTTDGVGIQLTGPARPRLGWVAGGEFYRDSVASGRVVNDLASGAEVETRGRFPDGATYRSMAFYGQTRVRAARRLELFLGARYSLFAADAFLTDLDSRYESDFDDLTGSANFLLELSPELRLSGGINQGFRAPGLDDATIFGVFNAGIEVPNPDLEPERLTSYELSLKLLNRRSWVSFTVYDSRIENLIARAPGTFLGSSIYLGETVFQRQNIDRAEIYGAEVDIRGRPLDRLLLGLALATTRGTNLRTGEPLRRIPPTSGRLTGRWLFPARAVWLELATDFATDQDRLSPGDVADTRIPEGGTPGYAVVSLGSGWSHPSGWRSSLVLYNLADVDYRTHGSGINGPGRSLRFLVEREFHWRRR